MGSWAAPSMNPPYSMALCLQTFLSYHFWEQNFRELFSTTALSQGRAAFKGVLESTPLTPNSLDVQNFTE